MHQVQAVRDGDFYTLAIPQMHGRHSIRVNGQPVEAGNYKAANLVTVRGIPAVEIFHPSDIAYRYCSLVWGVPDMTAAEWEAEDASLLARSKVDAEGQRHWADMADEVAHQRHRRGYRVEIRTEWVKGGDVELIVSDKVPEEPFIVPARMIGGDYMSAAASYDRPAFMLDLLRSRLTGMGMKEGGAFNGMPRGTFQVFNHNGEVSLHLPGGFRRSVRAHKVADSYARVRAMRDGDRDVVEGWISGWRDNYHRPVNAMEVGEELRELRKAVASLQVKAASVQERVAVLRGVDALIAKVEGAAEDKAA